MKKVAFVLFLLVWIPAFVFVCHAENDILLEYTLDSQPYPDCRMSVDVEGTVVKLSRDYEDAWTSYLEGNVRCRWYLDGNELSTQNETSILIAPSYVGCYLQAVLTLGEHTVMGKSILITEVPLPPQIVSSVLPDATVGRVYQTAIVCRDPGAVFTVLEPIALSSIGLTLDADGVLSGTPVTAGVYRFTVLASGQGGTDTCTFTLIVNEAPHVHVYGDWEIAKESDCLVQGKRVKNCECGHSVTEFLPLGDHNWNEGTVTKEPTEEEKGEKTHTCLVCGRIATTEVDKLPHTHVFRDWVIGELPTCGKPGYRVRTCACGETETEYFDGTEHIWDEGILTKDPTESEEGEMTFTCQYCGQVRLEPIAKLPHVHVYGDWTVEKEPTCMQTGMRVRVCACTFSESEEIPTTEHVWDSGTVTREPTEAQEGERCFACVNCQMTKSESIDRLPHIHIYSDWQVTEEPTCTKKGVQTQICRCTDAIIRDLPMTDHVWDEGNVTKEPTAKEEGERTFTCTGCQQTKTERIEKLSASESKPISKPKPEITPEQPLTSDTSFETTSSIGTVRMILLVTFLATALISVVTGVVLKRIK